MTKRLYLNLWFNGFFESIRLSDSINKKQIETLKEKVDELLIMLNKGDAIYTKSNLYIEIEQKETPKPSKELVDLPVEPARINAVDDYPF